MKHLEIEYKWQANIPRAFYRVKCALQQMQVPIRYTALNIHDVYLDHLNRDLAAHKIALRLRNVDKHWEATFKTRTALKNGQAVRREETLTLPGVKNRAQALSLLQQKKKWCGIDVTHLMPQFEIKNKRTIGEISFQSNVFELAFDRVCIGVCGRRIYMQEIELELKQGNKKAFEKFALQFSKQICLPVADFSKVRTAETLLKMWKK